MVFDSQQANNLTNFSIQANEDAAVTQEISNAENQIRQAGRFEAFKLSFNALVIGNPVNLDDSTLSPEQTRFRDHFVDNDYVVSIDPTNGNWLLDWSTVGSEVSTSMYSVRTTVLPGPVSTQTIDAINSFFTALSPTVTSRTEVVTINGGDVPESLFGAPDSVFYEYIVLADQPDDTDHSVALKAALAASGLGYVDDTRIVGVGTATTAVTTPGDEIDISDGTTTITITLTGTTASSFVTQVNSDAGLQAINITADINGPDLQLRNNLGGILTATDKVGTPVFDLFSLASPATGVLTDNVETFKFA